MGGGSIGYNSPQGYDLSGGGGIPTQDSSGMGDFNMGDMGGGMGA
jgi:hypothetical protein